MNSSEPAAPQADPRGFSRPLRILIVEHSLLDAELKVRTLKNTEHEIRADVVQTPDEFAEHLQARDYDVILSDYQLPDWNGLEALALLRQLGKDVPFLLVKCRDGSLVLVRQSARVAKDGLGHATHIEGIAEDVTERRALERQLRHVRKLEAIGQSAGGIAHDLNNVIGVILGWAGLGAEQTPAEIPLHHHFAKIKEQAERAAGLTRELLTFARRQMLEPQDISLNQTVAELLSLLEKLIGKGIELKTVLAPNLDLIRVDPAQMEQVLMNLCLNARDAMPRGGRMLIETQNWEIDEKYCRDHVNAHPGRYVLLSVTDNGEGMDAATQEHIFEPFFTTKEPGRGTGLGLATVYGVIKQHRGFLQVHSELGRGSVFCVHLPASGEAPEMGDRKAEPATDRAAEPVG